MSLKETGFKNKYFSMMSDLRDIYCLFLSCIETRSQLFFLEIDEIIESIVKKIITLFIFSLLIIFFIFSIGISFIIFFWDTYRNQAAIGMVIFFMCLVLYVLSYLIRHPSKSFFLSETLKQFKHDLEKSSGEKNEL